MTGLQRDLAAYGAYHRDGRNVATHCVGIPLIVVAIEVILARAGGVGLVAVAALAAGVYYLWLDVGLGVALCLFLGLGAAFGLWVGSWGLGVGLFVMGWVMQFVGHAFEGRKPAFFDDVRSLLTGPVFVAAEMAVGLGLRRALGAGEDNAG